MKKRKTWTYNCEYCGTHKHQRPAMERHEKYCTKNPNRKCRMCDIMGEVPIKPQEVADEISKRLPNYDRWSNSDMKQAEKHIRELCHDCPACIFSVLRVDMFKYAIEFNYPKECEEFFKDDRSEGNRPCY